MEYRKEDVAGREIDVQTREEDADKTSADLRDEDARLEQLREVLDTWEARLDLCEGVVASREATERELAACKAKLQCLVGQRAELVDLCGRREDELLRLDGKCKMQCDMF